MTARSRRPHLASLGFALVPGCEYDRQLVDDATESAADDGAADPAALTEDDAPLALAQARCSAEAQCQCPGFATFDSCRDTWTTSYENTIARGLAEGRHFDAACAAERIAAWTDPDCDYQDDDPEDLRWWNWCMVVHGDAQEGEPCHSDVSPFGACALGLVCSEFQEEGVCIAPAEEGGRCDSSSDCASGLFCDGVSCRTPAGLGGECETSDTCVGTAVCTDGQCRAPDGDTDMGNACNNFTY
jgi:hypothetical protein